MLLLLPVGPAVSSCTSRASGSLKYGGSLHFSFGGSTIKWSGTALESSTQINRNLFKHCFLAVAVCDGPVPHFVQKPAPYRPNLKFVLLRSFRLGLLGTRGLEDQRPGPWVCRLVAPPLGCPLIIRGLLLRLGRLFPAGKRRSLSLFSRQFSKVFCSGSGRP